MCTARRLNKIIFSKTQLSFIQQHFYILVLLTSLTKVQTLQRNVMTAQRASQDVWRQGVAQSTEQAYKPLIFKQRVLVGKGRTE